MNPLSLVGMALVGLLAVWIFLGSSSEQRADQALRQAKQDLAAAEFDRDFATAWNGDKKLSAPSAGVIAERASKVAALQSEAELRKAETASQEQDIKNELRKMAEQQK